MEIEIWILILWSGVVYINVIKVPTLHHMQLWLNCWLKHCKSIRPEVFWKKGFLDNFAELAGRPVYRSLFLIKLQVLVWKGRCYGIALSRQCEQENYRNLLMEDIKWNDGFMSFCFWRLCSIQMKLGSIPPPQWYIGLCDCNILPS